MPRQKKRKRIKKTRFSPRLFALGLISLGIVFILIPSIFYLNQSIQLAFFTPKVTSVNVARTLPKPTRIVIPKVRINLPIGETTVSRNIWGVYKEGASYLTLSARPGEGGPIIFYAHNTQDRFGPIRWLKTDDDIVIQTDDGKSHTYIIVQTLEVKPSEMEIFNQTEETLILYTCTGFGDLQRFVVLAKPTTQ
jgi:LPXTG-site transpeptidase (sortase) family protein